MNSRSVVVAGRRPAMLLSLKRVLEPEFEVAAMADNVLSMLDALKDFSPELLVMDADSAEFGAEHLAHRLHHRQPDMCIILVGSDEQPPPDLAGAHTAYVCKHAAGEALIPAARGLLAVLGAGR